MGRHRYRTWYYATGMPGWMRFGYGPGWSEVPPCCAPPCFGPGWWTGGPAPALSREEELGLLKEQAEMLEMDLQEIRARIEELKK